MGNSTELKDGQGPFNLGNSLVEIAALTSLIGSTAAESLALGDKGPAGLVWAMMTVFGAMPVVKQFIATATPGWLRESMGVRSSRSDAVVGLYLDLNKAFKFQARGDPAIAVECEIKVAQYTCSSSSTILMLCRMSKARKSKIPQWISSTDACMFSASTRPIF